MLQFQLIGFCGPSSLIFLQFGGVYKYVWFGFLAVFSLGTLASVILRFRCRCLCLARAFFSFMFAFFFCFCFALFWVLLFCLAVGELPPQFFIYLFIYFCCFDSVEFFRLLVCLFFFCGEGGRLFCAWLLLSWWYCIRLCSLVFFFMMPRLTLASDIVSMFFSQTFAVFL